MGQQAHRESVLPCDFAPTLVCGLFPTPPSNSLIPTGCPIIQHNSDIICLERASDPTGERLGPQNHPPPPSDANLKYRLSPVLLCNPSLDGRYQGPLSLGSFNLLGQLTELR